MLALPFHGIEAGGWASVEIANNPDLIEAGKPVRLDLTIKQHGISPVDIDPLVIAATNPDSGDTLEEAAEKADGPAITRSSLASRPRAFGSWKERLVASRRSIWARSMSA